MQNLPLHIATWVKKLVTSHEHATHAFCTHKSLTAFGLVAQKCVSVLWAKAAAIVNSWPAWSLGYSYPESSPLYFFSFELKDIYNELSDLGNKVSCLKEKLEAKLAYDEAEFLTTRQFAALVDVKPKTISNKASSGEFADLAKFENGQWLIHKSLVDYYGN